jgi:hypothetical protein
MAALELDAFKELDRAIEQLLQCKPLSEGEVKELCVKAQNVFVTENNVQPVAAPVTVRAQHTHACGGGARRPSGAYKPVELVHLASKPSLWHAEPAAACYDVRPEATEPFAARGAVNPAAAWRSCCRCPGCPLFPPACRCAATSTASSRTWWSCLGLAATARTQTICSWATMWIEATTQVGGGVGHGDCGGGGITKRPIVMCCEVQPASAHAFASQVAGVSMLQCSV